MCVRERNEGVASRHWFATGAILGIAYWFKASILLLGATVVVSAPVYWIAMMRKRPSGTEARVISSVVCLVIAFGFATITDEEAFETLTNGLRVTGEPSTQLSA